MSIEPTCIECAYEHEEGTPHNAESIFYQLTFAARHGRPPSWNDAMQDCDSTMRKLWMVVLEEQGYVDMDAPVTSFFKLNKEKEMPDGVQPSERLQGEDAMISERKGDENRVTLQSLTDKILHKVFIRADESGPNDGGTLTLCLLTMQNNFHIVGLAAPADRSKFDSELGEQLAFDDALRQAWRFEGYLMCEKLWREKHGAATDKINEAFPGSETIVEVDDTTD